MGQMNKTGMTHRQRAFVEAYQGNATEAAIKAGYSLKNADKIGSELLGKTRVSEAIRAREEAWHNALIATREERMIALTSIVRNLNEATKERIKAIDVLNKMSGEYLERVETTQKGPVVYRWMTEDDVGGGANA